MWRISATGKKERTVKKFDILEGTAAVVVG